jgi:chromosome segregation ATPase
MKDKANQKILVVAIVLMVISGLMAINSNKTLAKLQQNLDRERYQRMVAEENLNKAITRMNSMASELASTRNKIQSVQAILEEGQKNNSDLRSQLESTINAKEALEKKIEELKSAVSSKVPPVK